jgi:hypothetical protein
VCWVWSLSHVVACSFTGLSRSLPELSVRLSLLDRMQPGWTNRKGFDKTEERTESIPNLSNAIVHAEVRESPPGAVSTPAKAGAGERHQVLSRLMSSRKTRVF